jgi:hypothetical protein
MSGLAFPLRRLTGQFVEGVSAGLIFDIQYGNLVRDHQVVATKPTGTAGAVLSLGDRGGICIDDGQEVAALLCSALLFVVGGPDEQITIFPDGRDSDGKDEKKNRQQKAAHGAESI